jgi:hypothetical protein
MSATFFKIGFYHFHTVCCTFSKSLLVSAGNSLFCVMFKVLQVSWVTAVDSIQEIPAERSQVALGMRIVVAKVHVRQYDHRIPARKLFLFSHYVRSSHTVETSNALNSLPAEQ